MDDHPLRSASIELRMLLGVVWKVSQQAVDQWLVEHGIELTRLQINLLFMLKHEGTYTISDLSRKFGLDPSTLVPTVDALERKGYLRRQRDPEDRRRIPLHLTEQGKALMDEIPPVIEGDPLLLGMQAMGTEAACQLVRDIHTLIRSMPGTQDALEGALARLYTLGVKEEHLLCKQPDA